MIPEKLNNFRGEGRRLDFGWNKHGDFRICKVFSDDNFVLYFVPIFSLIIFKAKHEDCLIQLACNNYFDSGFSVF